MRTRRLKNSFRLAQSTKCGQCRTPLTTEEKLRHAEWCTRCADPKGYSDRLAVRQRELMAQRRQEMPKVIATQGELFDE